MKITLVTVGKMKEKYLRDAVAEYTKRLGKYCKLEVIETADEKTPDHASDTVEETIRAKEAERILRYIREDAFVITLEIQGKQLSSEELAKKIENPRRAGEEPYYLRDRRVDRAWEGSVGEIRFCPQFFKNDISSPADAGDFAGAGI